MAEFLIIGDTRVHELPEVAFKVEYTSARNIDKKESQGKDDAVATDKGRKVRDLTITVTWPDIARLNAILGPVAKDWDPSGPKGGQPFDWTHQRQGLDLGDIKAVRAIIFEEAKGPNLDVDTGINTLELKAASWVKPSTAPGTAKTPEDADKEKSTAGSSSVPTGFNPPGLPPVEPTVTP